MESFYFHISSNAVKPEYLISIDVLTFDDLIDFSIFLCYLLLEVGYDRAGEVVIGNNSVIIPVESFDATLKPCGFYVPFLLLIITMAFNML